MKNRLLIIFLLFSVPLLTIAQGIRFSAFADPQITWLKPEIRSIENAGVRGGLDVGFEMDNFFSENYAFSTGLSINSLGGKLKFQEPATIRFDGFTETVTEGQTVTYKLQYLNLPMGMKFTTREIGYTKIYVKLGATGHFNISSRADITAVGVEDDSLKDEIQPVNVSYHAGAGIQYSLGGETALIAGFEYKHRFIDITTNPDFKALLNSIGLRLGILF